MLVDGRDRAKARGHPGPAHGRDADAGKRRVAAAAEPVDRRRVARERLLPGLPGRTVGPLRPPQEPLMRQRRPDGRVDRALPYIRNELFDRLP